MPRTALNPSPATSRLINVHDVLEILDVSLRTLYTMIERGEFPRPLLGFRWRKWYRADVEKWLEGRRPKAG